MVLTVTEDTPADMLAGSMELLVQLPREHQLQTQRVTVQRSTPMMDLLVQIATAHKLAASSYTLQAIGERGLVLPHQPNTPIGALDVLQVKLLPKQGTFVPRKTKQANQPFETTFRLQVHLPRNQLYVSRVSPKMNLGKILDEVCREKNLDRNKYELRHPANLEETLDLSLSLQDYHLQEVTLYAKQGRTLGSALSTQDIMALQRQEERRRQQAKQGVFGFMFKKSKEGSLSTDSLGGRSASPARSDETARSSSPLQPPARPQRKRRPAPKPPIQNAVPEENAGDCKDKVVISHSRNSSDSSGYHEASVLSDNPDSAGRLPETLPRRNRPPETPRKLAHTSESSKSLGNLATASGTLSHGISSTSLSSAGLRKKRAAPPPPVTRPLSSAISSQALERIVDSEESLTSDMDPSKPPSDIGAPSKASSDIEERPKASSDIGVSTSTVKSPVALDPKVKSVASTSKEDPEAKTKRPDVQARRRSGSMSLESSKHDPDVRAPLDDAPDVESARVTSKKDPAPLPKPRKTSSGSVCAPPRVPKRRVAPLSTSSRPSSLESSKLDPSSSLPSTSTSEPLRSESSNDRNSPKKISNSTKNPPTNEKDEKMESTVSNDFEDDEERLSLKIDETNKTNSSVKSKTIVESIEKEIEKKSDMKRDRKCAVISTVPKCEHLESVVDDEQVDGKTRSEVEVDGSSRETRQKIFRSASKSNDFETNSLEKQKRHLTSHAEDISFALNLNLSPGVEEPSRRVELDGFGTREESCTGRAEDGKSRTGLTGISETTSGLSDTDILLRKVSDTLSNSLPVPPSMDPPESLSIESETFEGKSKAPRTSFESSNVVSPKETTKETNRETVDLPDAVLNSSTPNLTLSSQQDTSDYVSAGDEDLSITEWQYQLPAPPSAFRDSNSPVFDGYDTITLRSIEAFKEPTEPIDRPVAEEEKLPENSVKLENGTMEEFEVEEKDVELKNFIEKNTNDEKKSETNLGLKKEVISELENKIGTLPQNGTKDFDGRRIVDTSSTPKIAPVDNTLSNFTITTYTRQKSLNIFDEVDGSPQSVPYPKTSDERFMKSFPTLSRGRNLHELEDREAREISTSTSNLQTKKTSMDDELDCKKAEPKSQRQDAQRWQSSNVSNEKVNVQRSKSYVSVCDSTKHRAETSQSNGLEVKNHGNSSFERNEGKKSTSITSLNVPRNNEKFSQWRDNILKRQEEPTKEKQLQSLQVLRSILPQLKSAQQAEESVPKEYNSAILTEKTRSETAFDEYSTETSVSHRDSQESSDHKKEEVESRRPAQDSSTKRYTYSGPPAISLGSWSERPSVNVQIKMDTDYKLGSKKNTGGRTVVSINGSKDEHHHDATTIFDKNPSRNVDDKAETKSEHTDKWGSDELKKIISHTTASGFKKPILNKVSTLETKKFVEKPVVTGVELKKTFVEKNEGRNEESIVDTSPVNFKELARAFGEEVCLKPKPKRLVGNRRSENLSIEPEVSQIAESNLRHNGHVVSDAPSMNGGQKPKRFTSIVGIHPQNPSCAQNGLALKNNVNNAKVNPPMPVVKGFKIQTTKQSQNGVSVETSKVPQPPRPPTMPVIMGVTLKSTNARPKSMPVQIDARDVLLESIRNFGGRENLKSVSILT